MTAAQEARISLHVRGTDGSERVVSAVVDTGFTEEFSLPPAIIDALHLPSLRIDQATLADGTEINVAVHEASVLWDSHERPVTVHCLDGAPLIGMTLLMDHMLSIRVIPGGEVDVTPITE